MRGQNGHDRQGRLRLDWRRLHENKSWPHAKSAPRLASAPDASVTLDDVEAARGRAVAAPSSRPTATGAARCPGILGCKVWLKFENLQFTASFKERGALNRLLCSVGRGAQARRDRHVGRQPRAGRGLPCAAASRSPPPSSCPSSTPTVKVVNTRRHGAEVILHGETVEEAAAFAHGARARAGPHLHPPLRRSAGDRRAGHDRAGDAGRGARDRHAGGADRRRRPDLGHGDRRQGAQARHPRDRRAGRALSVDVQRHQGREPADARRYAWPRASP